MQTVKLSELFDIEKGKSYFNEFIEDDTGINYVTTSGQNQGVKCKVAKNDKYKIYLAGTITVALQGTVLSSFVQTEDFVLQTHVAALTPKKEMTLNEKLYYCMCIQANAFKFGFGRKANSTFSDLEVPAEIPDWVYEVEEPELSNYKESFNSNKTPELNISEWKEFKLTDLFDLKNGKGYLSSEALENPGDNPFVCSSETNNGIACYTSLANTHKGNCLTINKDGSVGCAFYQKKDFSTNKHVIVATPTFKNFNQYIAMFLIPIIELEKFKYCFGRAWGLDRMETTIIKLPATQNGEPDYEFMEEYIKTLPYSKHI